VAKFQKSDDGKVIDGAIVVWIDPATAAVSNDDSAAPGHSAAAPGSASKAAAMKAASKAQAAALVAAAKSGVPVCQRCDPPRGKNTAQ
jgi:hypothetical protein